MFRTNGDRLRQLIHAQGEGGISKVALGAKVGPSTLEKMMCGAYKSSPRSALRERLCRFFRVPESELFEVVGDGKETA